MKIIHSSLLLSFFIAMLFSCASRNKSPNMDYSGPPTMIYKLRNPDYYKLIPVELSEDKKTITSYPAISDIYKDGKFAYPVNLTKGYFLDNRGVGANTALLKLNYEEYSKLQPGFTAFDLFTMIQDIHPFVALYNCGNRYRFKNEVEELNQMIKKNNLRECKCLMKP